MKCLSKFIHQELISGRKHKGDITLQLFLCNADSVVKLSHAFTENGMLIGTSMVSYAFDDAVFVDNWIGIITCYL